MTEKKVNKAWMPVAIVFGILFVLAGMAALFHTNEVMPKDYQSPEQIQLAIENAVLNANNANSVTLAEKDAQIADLTSQLSEKVNDVVVDSVNTVSSAIGYVIDKIYLGLSDEMDVTLSDREVSKLVDSKIEFDDEDYDVEEVIELNGMKVLANEEDFESVPYLSIYEDSIKYLVIFDDDLNTSLIDEDEKLKFSFLGGLVEVSSWDGDSIVFTKGDEFYFNDDESKTVGEDVIVLEMVLENKVKVSVNGEVKTIYEGDTAKFGDLEVYVKDIDFSGYAGGYFGANLVIGNDIENEVSTGDEYSEDSVWEYVIDSNSIGIVLKEDFKDLDDDFKPLASSESLCLPNYVCVMYNGFLDEETEEVSFELDDEFVVIRGNFESGLDDYSKVYANASGIYDKDEVSLSDVVIGNSDVKIEVVSGNIVIEDFRLDLDLSNSNGSVDDSADYSYRTDLGIVVSDPEQSIDDEEWNIVVPFEKLESTVSVY